MKATISSVLIALTVIVALGAGSAKMKITSPVFSDGGSLPARFTCEGSDKSPPLQIEGAPAEAKSLVLIVDDPDAPGGLFTHWLVWNIGPTTNAMGEGTALPGISGTNDFGKSGYGGPCPPSGMHRYFFKVFALDGKLDLPAGAKRKQLDAAMKGHIVGQGELMGRYAHKK